MAMVVVGRRHKIKNSSSSGKKKLKSVFHSFDGTFEFSTPKELQQSNQATVMILKVGKGWMKPHKI